MDLAYVENDDVWPFSPCRAKGTCERSGEWEITVLLTCGGEVNVQVVVVEETWGYMPAVMSAS